MGFKGLLPQLFPNGGIATGYNHPLSMMMNLNGNQYNYPSQLMMNVIMHQNRVTEITDFQRDDRFNYNN